MRFNIEKHLQKIAEKKAKVKEKKKVKKKRQKEKVRELKKIETHKRALKKRREQYKPIHIKNLRHRQNQRYYKKKRAKELEEHRLKGDVYGFYRIIITKNYEQVNELSYSWWMLTAYDKFNKYVSENNSNVICLGAKFTTYDEAINYIEAFLNEKFEGGRHERRVNQIEE